MLKVLAMGPTPSSSRPLKAVRLLHGQYGILCTSSQESGRHASFGSGKSDSCLLLHRRSFIMANLRLATDLSLGPFDNNGGDGSQPNKSFRNNNNDAFLVKDSHTSWMQDAGKESYPAGFIDYLGVLPILKEGTCASYGGVDPAGSPDALCTQLTLFYAGTVNVFENVTADKAQMIMSLAGGGDSPSQVMDTIGLMVPSLKKADTPFLQPSSPCGLQVQVPSKKIQSRVHEETTTVKNPSIGENIQMPEERQAHELTDFLAPCQAMVPKALPLARKESLARFLERRKERVRMAAAPYMQKGNRPVSCSKARTQMLCNGIWAGSGMYMHPFNAQFVGTPYVEDRDWVAGYEDSRQVSEGESAT